MSQLLLVPKITTKHYIFLLCIAWGILYVGIFIFRCYQISSACSELTANFSRIHYIRIPRIVSVNYYSSNCHQSPVVIFDTSLYHFVMPYGSCWSQATCPSATNDRSVCWWSLWCRLEFCQVSFAAVSRGYFVLMPLASCFLRNINTISAAITLILTK